MTALADPVTDVRWNAAVALARRRDPAAVPVLLAMMDRARAGAACPASPTSSARRRWCRRWRRRPSLHDPRLDEAIRRLRDGDPDLKVRQAAHAATASPHP